MLHVENWAPTCANHTSESVGQNGGIFTETANARQAGMAAGQPREEKGKVPKFSVRVTKYRERFL